MLSLRPNGYAYAALSHRIVKELEVDSHPAEPWSNPVITYCDPTIRESVSADCLPTVLSALRSLGRQVSGPPVSKDVRTGWLLRRVVLTRVDIERLILKRRSFTCERECTRYIDAYRHHSNNVGEMVRHIHFVSTV